MIKLIKNFNWIIISSILCIFFGILTFLTFINESFIQLTDKNLQNLLIIDIGILIIFFFLIFQSVFKLYSTGKKNNTGYQTNLKYISLFSLFTFIPSLLVAIFSLFIFYFGIQKFFDTQITNAVNNSYEVAKNYLEDNKNNVKSDAILMSVGVNRASYFFYTNPKKFSDIIRAEKLLRRIDDVYLIDSSGNILFSNINEDTKFVNPTDEDFFRTLEGTPILVSSSPENKTTALIKLNSLIDTYLYISRNVDSEILNYLKDTEKAVSFYYTVENSQTGIKITFAIIYIIVVTLLLFLSIVLAIAFARRLTKPIVNLIQASKRISQGKLNSKVPDIESDDEFKILNKNFNNMIERLKKQQEKLIINERHEAWESVARKIAHEIKNPLTPIQLTIDRLREKYSTKIQGQTKEFENYLDTINRQIKDIQNLVNEFSNFARMPRPSFKKCNLNKILERAVSFFKISSKYEIKFSSKNKELFTMCDDDQLYRVFINIIKNSIESLDEKSHKKANFKGKIQIEITDNNDYIVISFIDNGIGISNTKMAIKPYFTTKSKGSGLGLPIVGKIITEHSGELILENNKKNNGALVEITLPALRNN